MVLNDCYHIYVICLEGSSWEGKTKDSPKRW
jgi:hypothetical protein